MICLAVAIPEVQVHDPSGTRITSPSDAAITCVFTWSLLHDAARRSAEYAAVNGARARNTESSNLIVISRQPPTRSHDTRRSNCRYPLYSLSGRGDQNLYLR